ncbi:unnamed protein product, partial [Mesorhabditis belari]|uniref:Uncharacterized protein n=1 Tax=Mesorhabditis belari TaxID=2138241 RepID=A0AAF3FG75_9BILA
MLKILLFVTLISFVYSFDKRQLLKGKYTVDKHPGQLIASPPENDASLGNEKSKHPISRRVLRWERSAEPLFEPESDFPMPEELQVLPGDLDFVKVRPHLAPKRKPSLINNEVEYDPALEF